MDPTDIHFELGWNEIGMLLFVLVLIYGLGGLKMFFGGRTKPHITRQAVPGGGDDGEEQSDDSESTGDPDDRA